DSGPGHQGSAARDPAALFRCLSARNRGVADRRRHGRDRRQSAWHRLRVDDGLAISASRSDVCPRAVDRHRRLAAQRPPAAGAAAVVRAGRHGGARRMSVTARILWVAGSVAVTALLILSWQLIADYGGIPPVFLPGPDRAWSALVSGFDGGELTHLTGATVERMIYGWVLASIAGIVIGALIGSSRLAREYGAP